MRRFAPSVAAMAVLTLLPAAARSQSRDQDDPPAASAGAESQSAQPENGENGQNGRNGHGRSLKASWQDALVLETDDGDVQIQLGAMVRLDGRFAPDDPRHVITDTLLMRAARVNVKGRLAKYFEFKVVPDFAGGSATLADCFIDIALSKTFHVRVGRDKAPMGFEVLQTDANVVFLERGFPAALLPSRDVGLQVLGTLSGGLVTYAGGVFNGVVDGTSSSSNIDNNSGKDLVGRITLSPFHNRAHTPLSGLGAALAGSTGRQAGALPSFKTSIQQYYFSYDPSAVADGMRTRVTPQVFYQHNNVELFSEYVRSAQAVTLGSAHAVVANRAWQAAGYITLTGEAVSDKLRPRRAFDPELHTWGAWQLTGRYAHLSVDPLAFALGLATPTSSREATTFTVGTNWYLTANVKGLLNVERTVFDENPNGRRYAEHSILFRVQLNY